jgi:glycerol-3-phosphate dehydrogenase
VKDFKLDVLIIGGGIAGLWLLDELHRRSFRTLLLESRALGAGQTIASQGILHGGLKYSLTGTLDRSSKAVAEMPQRWQASLRGEAAPDLRGVRVLSPCCYMWRTDSLASRAGLLAAQVVIRTAIDKIAKHDRPAALLRCPGDVLRVEEQVLDTSSLLEAFRSAHADRMLSIEGESTEIIDPKSEIQVSVVIAQGGQQAVFRPRLVVFCAGEGNAALRRKAGMPEHDMQTRPLHMVMVRGALPPLFGHCIDGNKTRATITTVRDSAGRTVWVVGGELAEKGIDLSESALIRFGREELHQVLPGVDFGDTQWATYRINRAEGRIPGNRRPDGTVWRKEGSIITAWPTKLVLAPQLACEIADSLTVSKHAAMDPVLPPGSPVPPVALPPWELAQQWTT